MLGLRPRASAAARFRRHAAAHRGRRYCPGSAVRAVGALRRGPAFGRAGRRGQLFRGGRLSAGRSKAVAAPRFDLLPNVSRSANVPEPEINRKNGSPETPGAIFADAPGLEAQHAEGLQARAGILRTSAMTTSRLLYSVRSGRRFRYSDVSRYWGSSRMTSGELMAEVFGEWRRGRPRPVRGRYRAVERGPGGRAPAGAFSIFKAGPRPPYWFLKRALGRPHGLDNG